MSQKKATIVNLAASNVSVSQFSAVSGSLVLEQFFVEEIAPGLTGDDEWLNAAIAALANLDPPVVRENFYQVAHDGGHAYIIAARYGPSKAGARSAFTDPSLRLTHGAVRPATARGRCGCR
jgi:hypothetical protein